MQGLSETWMYTVLFLLVMVGRRAVTTLWQVCACRGQEHRRRSFLAAFIAKLVAKYFTLQIYARPRPTRPLRPGYVSRLLHNTCRLKRCGSTRAACRCFQATGIRWLHPRRMSACALTGATRLTGSSAIDHSQSTARQLIAPGFAYHLEEDAACLAPVLGLFLPCRCLW